MGRLRDRIFVEKVWPLNYRRSPAAQNFRPYPAGRLWQGTRFARPAGWLPVGSLRRRGSQFTGELWRMGKQWRHSGPAPAARASKALGKGHIDPGFADSLLVPGFRHELFGSEKGRIRFFGRAGSIRKRKGEMPAVAKIVRLPFDHNFRNSPR